MTSNISPEYRAQLEQLHRDRPDFGTSAHIYADFIRGLIHKFKPEGLCDFGCGKAVLKDALGIKEGYFGYDPAIPEYSQVPDPQDLVTCCDVLEHCELGREEGVIAELAQVTKKIGFFVVHTGPAMHILPDGKNAHLIQQPASWWLPKLLKHFEPLAMETDTYGFWIVVKPKESYEHH